MAKIISNTTQAKDSGTRGAMAELAASIFFLDQGFHVYRSISRTGIHDLVIIKQGKTNTVQVTTGSKVVNSCRLNHSKKINECKSDYLFVYHKDGGVLYDVKSGYKVNIVTSATTNSV